jgi:ATP-dependent DNA helicase DinG
VPEVPALSGTSGLKAAVSAAFADQGSLAQIVDHFEPRIGQRTMAAAVAETIADGGILLAEAGTGTGKTLAYLVPAILSRQRVLVSTGTKNLQEQIYFKDLPILREALGVAFKATYMKGRANYLCLHRLDQLRSGMGGFGYRVSAGVSPDFVSMMDEWLRTTDTGDRAELGELPEDSSEWHEVSATAETCLGSDCPRYDECFVTRMRQRAAESDIVIVNHHLLCADASLRQSSYGEVIPPSRYVVLDEAHQLEDVATQYFGIAVSNYRVDDLMRDADRALNFGEIEDDDGDLRRELRHVDDHARGFFGQLSQARQSRGAFDGRLGDERLRIGPDWFGHIVDDGVALIGALDRVSSAMARFGGGDEAAPGSKASEDAAAIARRAAEMADNLRFLLAASDSSFVYFLETRGRGVFLRAAPIDVSRLVREFLVDRMHATVLTSATLTVEGSFDYVKGRLGLDDVSEVRVPSEFDFAEQAILYLPQRMPSPKSPEYGPAVASEVMEILACSRGRAFVLFTSYAMLRTVRDLIELELPYPLLVQGTAPRSVLLNQFRATPNAVLLATSSFWQGVDVIGEQLSCVIIDKLPFASPGDPITAARIEAIGADGRDAFQEYQIPLAILSMLQGLGRLIRHRTDRGVLAVLDPRLRTMGYGRRFLDSFPPAPITLRLDEVRRFFAE